jgi:hypothetical protein
MRRILFFVTSLVALLVIAGCDSEDTAAAVDSETPVADSEHAITVENAFYYTHVDGHRKESQFPAFVLFEYEQLRTVKYQVGYIMCTCRGPEVNYWSVAYVELNKSDGSVEFLSFEEDSTGKYVGGLYGDSKESWDGTPVRELFDGFMEEELIGATQEEINAMEPMHGEVDTYTGATVTPNNAVRMLQGLFEYHNRKYS